MKNTLAKLMNFFETTNKFDKKIKKNMLKSILRENNRYISVKIS